MFASLATDLCALPREDSVLGVALRGTGYRGTDVGHCVLVCSWAALPGVTALSVPVLTLENVCVSHDGRLVLTGVNLSVEAGRWIALVGPNASGKTTLLRAIAGRHSPSRGVVRIDGMPLYPAKDWVGRLPGFAVSPEELPSFLTVRQCLEIHANAHGFPTVPGESNELGSSLDMDPHAHTLVRDASFGTRQKLAIMLALMPPPSLLLLDEVFNGLDFASGMQLRDYLRQRVDAGKLTVLLATHSLDVVVRCCDELVLLHSGTTIRHWDARDFSGPDGIPSLERALVNATGGGGGDPPRPRDPRK